MGAVMTSRLITVRKDTEARVQLGARVITTEVFDIESGALRDARRYRGKAVIEGRLYIVRAFDRGDVWLAGQLADDNTPATYCCIACRADDHHKCSRLMLTDSALVCTCVDPAHSPDGAPHNGQGAQ